MSVGKLLDAPTKLLSIIIMFFSAVGHLTVFLVLEVVCRRRQCCAVLCVTVTCVGLESRLDSTRLDSTRLDLTPQLDCREVRNSGRPTTTTAKCITSLLPHHCYHSSSL